MSPLASRLQAPRVEHLRDLLRLATRQEARVPDDGPRVEDDRFDDAVVLRRSVERPVRAGTQPDEDEPRAQPAPRRGRRRSRRPGRRTRACRTCRRRDNGAGRRRRRRGPRGPSGPRARPARPSAGRLHPEPVRADATDGAGIEEDGAQVARAARRARPGSRTARRTAARSGSAVSRMRTSAWRRSRGCPARMAAATVAAARAGRSTAGPRPAASQRRNRSEDRDRLEYCSGWKTIFGQPAPAAWVTSAPPPASASTSFRDDRHPVAVEEQRAVDPGRQEPGESEPAGRRVTVEADRAKPPISRRSTPGAAAADRWLRRSNPRRRWHRHRPALPVRCARSGARRRHAARAARFGPCPARPRGRARRSGLRRRRPRPPPARRDPGRSPRPARCPAWSRATPPPRRSPAATRGPGPDPRARRRCRPLPEGRSAASASRRPRGRAAQARRARYEVISSQPHGGRIRTAVAWRGSAASWKVPKTGSGSTSRTSARAAGAGRPDAISARGAVALAGSFASPAMSVTMPPRRSGSGCARAG